MKLKQRQRDTLNFYGFASPWIIGFLLFSVIPMGVSLYYSFTKISVIQIGRRSPSFVGFSNYIRVFTKDRDFVASIVNTFGFTFLKVLFMVVISMLIALLLNRAMPGKRLFRTLIYLPSIIPIIGAALLWQLLLSNDLSLINYVLSFFHIPPIQFLNLKNALSSVVLMSVWGGIGPTMILLLAALQGVPNDLYEAVTLDGGGWFAKFKNVTMPFISPTLLYTTITGLIGGLQSYAEMKLLTNGGPGNATTTMSMLVVNNAFMDDGLGLGYACSEAWVIFAITLVFTGIFFATSNKFVYYGGDK